MLFGEKSPLRPWRRRARPGGASRRNKQGLGVLVPALPPPSRPGVSSGEGRSQALPVSAENSLRCSSVALLQQVSIM